jgi:hypothetical protein
MRSPQQLFQNRRPQAIHGQRGVSLISVLVAAAITGIVALAMARLTSNQSQAQDILTARAQEQEMRWNMSLILGKSGACAKTGLVGLTIDPANPIATDIVLRNPSNGPQGPVFLKEGTKVPGSRWRVTKLKIISMVNIGSSAYYSVLQTEATYRAGNATSDAIASKTLKFDFPLQLVLGAGNVITGCGTSPFTTYERSCQLSHQADYTPPYALNSCSIDCPAGTVVTGGGIDAGKVVMGDAGGWSAKKTGNGYACGINIGACTNGGTWGSGGDGCSARCHVVCVGA